MVGDVPKEDQFLLHVIFKFKLLYKYMNKLLYRKTAFRVPVNK